MKFPISSPAHLVRLGLVASVLGIAGRAAADGPPPLPPVAYEACDAKNDGDACTVQLPNRELHGSCKPDRDGKRLFCLPTDMPPPPQAPEGGGK